MEKRLYRSRKKKVIAGICGGLGDHLDIDPVILRIIFVLITIFHGIGILIYIIMWIVIPEESYSPPSTAEAATEPESPANSEEKARELPNEKNGGNSSSGGRIVFGVILILVGLVFLSERYLPFFDFEFVFAIGLIALGLSLLFNFFNKSEKTL